MNAQVLSSSDPQVDAYVKSQPQCKICHLPAWSRMLERTFGYEPHYLVTREGDAVRGVLPLTRVRSRLFGDRMISQAFSNYGGVLADSPEAQQELFSLAAKRAAQRQCASIEFRNIVSLPYDLQPRPGKLCMHLALTADPEQLWKGLDAKVRNQVRKAQKSGVVAASGQAELLDEFYEVYTVRMHQLGSPCYPRKLMAAIMADFPQSGRVFVVRKDGRTLGAAFIMSFNGFAEIPWAATLVEFNPLCPNNLLYWSVLEHCCKAGDRWFDFGRSTVESNTHKFKEQWGPQAVQLNYQYWVRPGTTLSAATVDNPKYQRKTELWKKLPLWATRILGPMISRGLP